MISLFDYIPARYEATEREKQIRSLIWDFKAGKRSKQVAAIVAGKIAEKFGSFADTIVFVCVPASSAERTEKRYRDFCEEVSNLCGCMNGYKAVKVGGKRMTIHETKKGKSYMAFQFQSCTMNHLPYTRLPFYTRCRSCC